MMILSTQVATRASDETLKLWDLRQTKTAVHTADGLPSRFSMTDCCFRFYSLVFFCCDWMRFYLFSGINRALLAISLVFSLDFCSRRGFSFQFLGFDSVFLELEAI